jgi:K+-sensing histidine kinase KdpD
VRRDGSHFSQTNLVMIYLLGVVAAAPARAPTPCRPPRASTSRSAPPGIVGVLGIHPAGPQLLVSPERLHLLEAFADQIALAVE